MAHNVSRRMGYIDNILRTSLLKTLAHKHQCTVNRVVKKYRAVTPLGRILQVVIKRPEKEPLVAIYGGIPLKRMPQGQGRTNCSVDQLWFSPASNRSELVQRLLAEKCELCGKKGPLEAHHIRKIADIDRPGRRPTENWQKIMASRRRKSLVVCAECHDEIHAGRYDGPPL